MLDFFKEVNLTCSNCGREIKENEPFTVTLKLPSKKKMPVGVLDKVLAKHAEKILCTQCQSVCV